MAAKKRRIEEIDKEMSEAGFWDRKGETQEVVAELSRFKAVIEPFARLERSIDDLKTLAELAQEEQSEETVGELEREIPLLEAELQGLEFKAMLSGEDDHRNSFFSIHAGAGGTESCDWVEMLLRMYTRWFDNNRYKWEVIDSLSGDEAGLKRVALRVQGDHAYGYLKAEVGVHRLVRISPFDSNKRRHTSFASVDCVPEIEEEVIEITPNDIEIDTYRASGPGGQHVNVTDSAVRVTHIPTGLVVQCQNERSQHKNKRMALSILRGKIHQLAEKKREEALAKQRGEKTEIAWGNQIRSYVLHPYTMVKDHRTGVETANAQNVLDGAITEFIEEYLKSSIGNGGDDGRK